MKIRQKRAREILILILKSRSLIDKERALIEKYHLQKVADLLKSPTWSQKSFAPILIFENFTDRKHQKPPNPTFNHSTS